MIQALLYRKKGQFFLPRLPFVMLLTAILLSCSKSAEVRQEHSKDRIFKRLPASETGLTFTNELEESEDFDVFRYRNYYNGAGVSIGDINNDGLADVYITSNSKVNKLFLNLGNFRFKDITESAGVGGAKAWSTGVSMADVNADGLLDIYVCNSGDIKGDDKENELFINNGDLTFTERAKEYGLADQGFSTHAVFFDYDKDGDLDCYLLNNSFRPVSTLGYKNIRHQRDELGGHKLFQNDNGVFKDVSEKAGIFGSVIGFGLGVTVGDVNHDNWPDIYVSNDFFERDYLYINNHDGTFREQLEDYLGHTSMFSMGADVADLNNDGYLDIFSTDMLPEDNHRLKTITFFESYDVYQIKIKNGYYHQYMRNMLQINNHDGTFSEVGQLAGVSATDWSWGALLADFNNDGYKEIFVSNGIYRDVTDQDFLEYMANEENIRAALEGRKIDYQRVIKQMPSNKLNNFLFARDTLLHYKNVAQAWGIDEPSFSNGAAYGDLDNDGDLDLIVNNVNQELFVYQNQLNTRKENHYIALSFKGKDKNTFGLGAKVEIFRDREVIVQENMPIRGYESSMDYKLVIGVGANAKIDSMTVTWPDGSLQTFSNLATDQHLKLDQKNAALPRAGKKPSASEPLMKEADLAAPFVHRENEYNDFNDQRLLYEMLSTEGPALATGDVNGDNLDDFYIGGAKGQIGAIFLQKKDGTFRKLNTPTFDADSASEDVDAIFLDVDNDADLDLYVVSGGNEFPGDAPELQDRLYINYGLSNGSPAFLKSVQGLPDIRKNGSCVAAADYDHDGDVDVFLGTRAIAGQYGMPADQYILENDGTGQFKNVSDQSPDLKKLGMVTDAKWFDYNGDGLQDLVIAGDWMPVTVLRNTGNTFQKEKIPSLEHSSGWWNSLETADIDGDGDTDFIAGNLGLNSKFKPTASSPVSLYVGDLDQNGSVEQVYACRKNGVDYPVALKQDLAKQMNFLNKKFIYYKDYADKSIQEVFGTDRLKGAIILTVEEDRTVIFVNNGSEGFSKKILPLEAQFAPVYSIRSIDITGDNVKDLILGGNMFSVKTEIGRFDALHGLVLEGDAAGNFHSLTFATSGFRVMGQVRCIGLLNGNGLRTLVVAQNNDVVKFFRISAKGKE